MSYVDGINNVVNVDASSIIHRDFTIPAGATCHTISADMHESTVGGISSSAGARVDYEFRLKGFPVKSGYGFITNFEKSSNNNRQSRTSLFDMLNLKFPVGMGDITLRVMVENFDNSKGLVVSIFCPYTGVSYN